MEQEPLGSGGGRRRLLRKYSQEKNLHNKFTIVIGGHSGLGLEMTRILSKAEASIARIAT